LTPVATTTATLTIRTPSRDVLGEGIRTNTLVARVLGVKNGRALIEVRVPD
jgi:hypothetical protein